MTKPIHASRQIVEPNFFAVAEIDSDKVEAITAHLLAGGEVPPVVLAFYQDSFMPLDGHHGLSAYKALGMPIDAWVADGEVFDDLCAEERNAETFVLCDGVPV